MDGSAVFGSDDENFELGYGDENLGIEPIGRGENVDVNGSLLNISAFQMDDPAPRTDAESIMRNGYSATPMAERGPLEEKSASGGSRLLRKRVIDRAGDTTPGRDSRFEGSKSDISFPSLPAPPTPLGGRMLGARTPGAASPGVERKPGGDSVVLNFPPLDGGGQGSSIINFPPLGGPAAPKSPVQLNFPPLAGESPVRPGMGLSPGGRPGASPFVPPARQEPFVPQPEPFVPEPQPFVPQPQPFVPPPHEEPFVPEPQPFVPQPEPFVPEPQPFVPPPHEEPFVPEPQPEPFVPGAPVPMPSPEAPTPTPILKTSPFLLRKNTLASPSPSRPEAATPTANRVTFEGAPRHDDLAQTQPVFNNAQFDPLPSAQSQVSAAAQLDRVENRVSNSFDKAVSGFRRMFGCELSSIMRPNVSRMPEFDVDAFCEGLVQDVNEQLQIIAPPLEGQLQALSQKIGQTIDDETIPVISRLSATSIEEKEFNTKFAECLKRVRADLDTLKSDFRAGTESLILSLENERDFTISSHEHDKSRESEIERRLRQLKYKRTEMETKASHQKTEADALYRALKALESKRKDFFEELLHGYSSMSATGTGRITNKILSEIKETRRELASNDDSDLMSALDAVLNDLSTDTEACRKELMECEICARHVLLRLSQQKRPRLPASPRRASQSSGNITSLAQQRIEESRRARNSPLRGRA